MCLRGWFQDLLQIPNCKDAQVRKLALCIRSSTSRDSISSRSSHTICIYWGKKSIYECPTQFKSLLFKNQLYCLFSSRPTGLKVP